MMTETENETAPTFVVMVEGGLKKLELFLE
jgi:hypothetical protein